MSRVVATLSAKRASVVPSKSDGKTLSSSGVFTYTVDKSSITATVMLAANNRSITPGGKGTKITIKQRMIPIGSNKSGNRLAKFMNS